jgi:hypothetical protein
MSSNWGKQVADATVKLVSNSEKRVKKSIRRTCVDIVMQTPVDKGMLINNWYASNKQIPVRRTKQLDPSGAKSISRIDKAVERYKLGQTFYLVNNLPYANVVEYGKYPNPPQNPTGKTVNGFSKQAPAGMVRINAQKMINRIKGAS